MRKAVDYLQKDKSVGGKYLAVTHDAVTAAVRDHLVVHGVLIVPRLITSHVELTDVATAKGIRYIRYAATYAIEFVNCDEPSDKIEVIMEAHAMDEGDKAPGKAVSYATKYAILKLFSIQTGEDEEARPVMKPVNQSSIDEKIGNVLSAKITPNADARIDVTLEELAAMEILAQDIHTFTAVKDFCGAEERLYTATWEGNPLTQEQKLAAWSFLSSSEKTGITKAHNERKGN